MSVRIDIKAGIVVMNGRRNTKQAGPMKIKTNVEAGGGSRLQPAASTAPASNLPDWGMR